MYESTYLVWKYHAQMNKSQRVLLKFKHLRMKRTAINAIVTVPQIDSSNGKKLMLVDYIEQLSSLSRV